MKIEFLSAPQIDASFLWIGNIGHANLGAHLQTGWHLKLGAEMISLSKPSDMVPLLPVLEMSRENFYSRLAKAAQLRPEFDRVLHSFPEGLLFKCAFELSASDYWPTMALNWLESESNLVEEVRESLQTLSKQRWATQKVKQRVAAILKGVSQISSKNAIDKSADKYSIKGVEQTEKLEVKKEPSSSKTRTPLMTAVLARDAGSTKSLISRGEDVNARSGHVEDRNGTPLMMAIWSNQADIAELLLESGADVNVQDAIGETPLIIAASSNLPLLVNLLLQHGADANLADNIGRTPLMWACRDTNNIEMIKALIAAGADINRRDDRGWTAKDYAEAIERPEMSAYLASL